jgi:tripartite-type tricarboxylate transporter receptor subunit TctC
MLRLLGFLLPLLAFAASAPAQEFPRQPVKMVVPYAPGGLPDTMTRILGTRLGEQLGQQVIVENRAGAGGISGSEAVARAAPDGYTLLVADVGQVAINPFLFTKLPYDPEKDLVPVSLVGTSTLFLCLNPGVKAASFKELVQLAKQNPGKLSYGSSGVGSIQHLAVEAMKTALGLDILHVPYKGNGQAVPALLSGEISMLYSALPAIEGYVKSGRLRIVAASTATRAPQLAEVPTVAESGVPGYQFAPEIGILAPTGVPAPVLKKLSAEIARAVRHPEIVRRYRELGIDAVGSTPEEYAATIQASRRRYAEVVRTTGIKAD